jgi:hypothetical protein
VTRVTTDPVDRRHRDSAARALRIGAIVLVVGGALTFFPLLLDLRGLNKYVVAVGLIGVLIGLGCLANGAIDALRARSR